jgi:hypothetical protein
MSSNKERKKTIERYIKYNKFASAVIRRELGYPYSSGRLRVHLPSSIHGCSVDNESIHTIFGDQIDNHSSS